MEAGLPGSRQVSLPEPWQLPKARQLKDGRK
ncbi:Hypothetical protein Bdt_1509 [Bdellovibrio bacteriovorus str. Tiberius]|uniref:Uncharacterized protein n=1 Tax=Bdellovibrio bacteriovorus str. Tiberius TaxID=1069642 RepID=K7YWV2_BDEBC|nr:Hypothetical protein Bdt_1509 [Bdellovibrio bacteriovorus str. Tiberius]